MRAGDDGDTAGPDRPGATPGGEPPVPAAVPRRGARLSAWLAVGALVAALVTLPFGDTGLLASGVLAEVADGPVQRQTAGGWASAPAGTELSDGAVVRVRDGRGTLALADGGTLRLAPGTRVELATDGIDVAAGSVLLEVDDPLTVRWEGLAVRGQGAWRLDAAGFTRAGVYRGTATVRGPSGSEVTVGRLQQLSLTDGAVTGEPAPLRYTPEDPWDARLLAGAIEVDRFVAQLQRSLAAEYGTAPRDAAFYRAFGASPAVSDALLGALEGGAPAGGLGTPDRVLTALTVVQTLVDRAGLGPAAAAEQVVSVRNAGGRWGLILARHDLGAAALREVVDGALERVQQTGPPGGGGTADTGQPADGPADGGDDGTGGGDSGGQPPDGSGPSDTPGDGGSDGGGPGGGDDDGGSGGGGSQPPQDDDALGGTVDGITGTVDSLLPGAPVDGLTDAAGDLLNSQSSGSTGSGGDGSDTGGTSDGGTSGGSTDGTSGGSQSGSSPGGGSTDGSASDGDSAGDAGSTDGGTGEGSGQQEDPPLDGPVEDTLDGVGGTLDGLLPGDPVDETTDSVGGLLD